MLGLLAIPAQMKQIIIVMLAVIALLWLLQTFGLALGAPFA